MEITVNPHHPKIVNGDHLWIPTLDRYFEVLLIGDDDTLYLIEEEKEKRSWLWRLVSWL